MSDDAFQAPGEEPAALEKAPLAPGELPEIGTVFNETLEDFTENIADYALAGLGFFIVTMVLVFGAIFVLYGGMAAFMFGGIAVGTAVGGDAGPILAMIIMFGGIFISIFGFMAVLVSIMMPIQASLERAIRDHHRGEGKLGFGSAFSTMFQDLPKIIGVGLLLVASSMLGILALYIGAMVTAWLFYWAPSLVALSGKSPIEAMKTSAGRVWEDKGGVGVLTVVAFLLSMVAAYVPIVGPMFGLSLKVRLHQAIFENPAEA
ncbi:MAG: hypothetical protein KC912_01645 [Proteobacteria bacterium]|nr:hypothetical protein [Pseudomonadota bacterium]